MSISEDGTTISLGTELKTRITFADKAGADAVSLDTFSSCLDAVSHRILTLFALKIRALMTSLDVSSAYYQGTPLTVA